MINQEYIKNYLIENKIIFPTNLHDNIQSGFQNYGPIGLKIKNKIINIWRKNFIEENIFEIESPVISNQTVLTRSGHVQKFNDLGIVFLDSKTHEIKSVKRADHFIEDKIIELGLDMTYQEDVKFISDFIHNYNLVDLTNEYIQIKPQSLMFKLDGIGENLYLRPEVAQTIFVEFKQFYDYNNSRLPFGIGQVGKSYRNEISDKPFIRLREFTQAEVEYFYNPFDSFDFDIPTDYKNKSCLILSSEMQANNQTQIKITLSELDKYIVNPVLRKFAFKLYVFAEQIGLDWNRLRFRQHKSDEMAHYARDCWDLEAEIFSKWLEITGIADRADYDLKTHDKNGVFQVKKYKNPVIKYKLVPKTREIFKSNPKEIALEIIKSNKETIVDTIEEAEKYPKEYYSIEEFKYFEMITPYVIEPSLGIDRIFYTLIVHNLSIRADSTRPYLLLNKNISPYDFMLAQLSSHSDLLNKLNEIVDKFKNKFNIFTDLSSTTIGKRYTRADELGIIYSITIDFETLTTNTVTIRNIQDMSQTRVDIYQIQNLIGN